VSRKVKEEKSIKRHALPKSKRKIQVDRVPVAMETRENKKFLSLSGVAVNRKMRPVVDLLAEGKINREQPGGR
jgi:hypothetical protein